LYKIHDEYSKLELIISDISEKVFDSLKDQREEFLSAYKALSENVQSKVDEIKQTVEQKEREINEHVLVKELIKERDWYRQEVVNLDKLLREAKKAESDLKDRLDEVSSDRRWLSDQVRTLMNKKAELEEQVSKK